MPLVCMDMRAVQSYVEFLRTRSEGEIARVFGSKVLMMEELSLCQNLARTARTESIRLYNGVAYKALDFDTLHIQAQDYIFKNLYIFSNLFGLVRASDRIPYYNLHQGKGFGDFELRTLYRRIASQLDGIFASSAVLDLRAEAYVKAYLPPSIHPSTYTQIHFFKNGKKVSHYAKFYRGAYVRALALAGVENLNELESLYVDGLRFKERYESQNATILVYEVC